MFYGAVLGLTLVESSPYALAYMDGGTMLRVQIVDALTPAQYTVYGWQVSDIGAEVDALTAKGATFQTFPNLTQDAKGIWTTPGGAKIAWFNDPSGNVLSLTQFAPS